ncbi:MAG: hypothetical protein OEV59_07510 [Deltaproteobacteria bacterium]|nr:hypothetical protein [Deltaproteobacteria bacterium]
MAININNEVTREALTMLAAIERVAARLYKHFNEKFGTKDGVDWGKMALEEEEHARFFETQKRMLDTVPNVFGRTLISLVELKRLTEKLSGIAVEGMKDDVTLEKALRIGYVIEVEVSESENIKLMHIKSESLRKVFDSILIETVSHKEQILRAADRNGVILSAA